MTPTRGSPARTIGLLLGLLASGCVSAFPEETLRSVNRTLSLAELRRDPAAHVSQRVIMGGEILVTRPKPGETEIEVLGRRLERDDSPERSDRSDGRFLVTTKEFLDPAVYAGGRRVTIVGTVAGAEERAIGDLPYRYPLLEAERIRLWAREIAPPPGLYPYPYFGFYPRPYHPRFGRRYHYWPSDPFWW